MHNPTVTVVIPCFDREETVRDAVESVLIQDYAPFDVIAVDDNSTDGTRAVLEEITDPRLRVTVNPGARGPSSTRNHGVAMSDADWVAFQDSDDLWLPGKLAAQMARVAGSDYVAVYCGMLVKADTDPNTPVQRRYPDRTVHPLEGDILPSLTRGNYISTQMLAVRRDVFDKVGGFDEELPALVDWDLMLRVAGQGPVAFVDADLVVQRMTENSITKSTQKRLAAQEYVLKKHRDLLAHYPASLAQHHHRVAGGYRSFGQYRQGVPHAQAAWRLQPGNLKYLASALWTSLRGVAT